MLCIKSAREGIIHTSPGGDATGDATRHIHIHWLVAALLVAKVKNTPLGQPPTHDQIRTRAEHAFGPHFGAFATQI